MTALTRCPGPNGAVCADNALVPPGRLCSECHQRSGPPKPKPAPKKRPRRNDIEALIRAANSEAVQAERAAWRGSRRR